ncbi:hypothetical protein AB0H34_03055 [Saccharopolyspora shandongensis]|uniref:hypothetical protein n=1 Tax=Saccharopolyspora shandongensis TaxID=418495 RepID=UPI0033DD6EB5
MTIRTYEVGERDPRTVVWFVRNPSDGPGIAAALATGDARSRGILLVRLSPASTSMAGLACDTLRAVKVTAKDIERARVEDDQLPAVVTYRLCGLGVAVLAIDCPRPLSAAQLRLARRWCDHVRARLVIIGRWPTVRPYLPVTVEEILRTPRLRQRDSAQPWPQLDPEMLPADDFPTFRAACQRRVPEHAEAIDRLYRDAYDRTRVQLEQPHRSAYDNALMALFHGLTLHDPPPAARLITLRAVQAAVFTHGGLFLKWSPRNGEGVSGALAGTATPRHHINGLRAVLDPLSAVANMLWGHCEMSPYSMGDVAPGDLVLEDTDLPEHGRVIAPSFLVGNLVLRLPDWSLPYLRAFRCQRDHGDWAVAPDVRMLLCLHRSPAADYFHASRCTHYGSASGRSAYFFPFDTHGEVLRRSTANWDVRAPLEVWLTSRWLYLHQSFEPSPDSAWIR